MINDPVKRFFNIHWGDLGYVTIFFLISGFTIAQSFFNYNKIFDFIKSRSLRIFPAVISANVFVIIVCAFLIKISIWDYLTSKDVLYYFYKNTILVLDIRPRLGFGIFETNPYPKIINSQWWTLPWNLKMYGLIVLCFIFKKIKQPMVFNLLFCLILFFSFYPATQIGWWNKILPYFFTGVFFYINKKNIPIHFYYFLLSFVLYILFFKTNLEIYFSPFFKAYMIFYLVFVPKDVLKMINISNDYSLGIFLYHLFVQQLLIHFGVTDIMTLFLSSLIISVILAVLSFHFIEAPALRLKTKEFNFNNFCFASIKPNS